MIAIIVDTNILRESPYLSRPEWTSLAEHTSDWELSLLVPDVVVMETTRVVAREWTSQKDTLSSAKVGTFGLQEDLDALVQGIQNHIDSYEAQLHSQMSEMGVHIVPTPDIPHSEIALRASRGIAPYHAGDKDGYRDTLIWLTVLDVAMTRPDHEVWFVSNNTNDFGDPSVKNKGNSRSDAPQLLRPLHPDLQQDLERRGLKDRVKYTTSLRSLEQHIAALHGPIAPDHLAALTSLLNFDALQELLNEQTSIFIAPKDAALTPGTDKAVINNFITRDSAWAFSDAAGRGEDRWTANYVVDAEVEIFTFSDAPSPPAASVTKTLRVSGTAAFTKHGQPEEIQISRIEALPDDPNRGLWSVLTASGFGQLDLVGNSGFASLIHAANAVKGLTVPPEAFKSLIQAANAAKGLTVPPEAFKSLIQAANAAKGLTVPPEAFKSLIQATNAAKGLTVPPEALQSFIHAANAAKETKPRAKQDEEPAEDEASTDSAVPDTPEEPEKDAGDSTS